MSGESKTSATMFADTDAVKKFWIYLDVFYYQQGSCDELYSAVLHTKNGPGSHRNAEEELHYNTIVNFHRHFHPMFFPGTSGPPFPGRKLLDQERQTIWSDPTITASGSTSNASNASNILRCINLAFDMHGQYLQLSKVQNYSSTERKRWKGTTIEICQHLLGWSDQQLAKIADTNAPNVSNAVWIFNFLLRLEQLIALLPPANHDDDNELEISSIQNLMDQHRSLTVRLSKCLPRGNYRACFDEEERQSEGARLAKLDEEKWTTGMPNALNRLTSDYCSFDILSDLEVNAVLERVKLETTTAAAITVAVEQ